MQAGSELAMEDAACASANTTLPSEIQTNSTQAPFPHRNFKDSPSLPNLR